MFDREEGIVERVIRHLRRPVAVDRTFDARVMQEIAALPAHRSRARWLRAAPWLAAAAILAALVVVRPWTREADSFQFLLVAPSAASVALVGDFNDWDPARTPMHAARGGDGVWATAVPLAPGRYRYAFLVNGAEWRADPRAPRASDDDFGTPSSVVTVGGT